MCLCAAPENEPSGVTWPCSVWILVLFLMKFAREVFSRRSEVILWRSLGIWAVILFS